MKEFSFNKSIKSLRGSSLKKKSVTLKCRTEKERFSVTVSRFGVSNASDDTKRPPELFELRTCTNRKKDSSVFSNPYDLIRTIANSIKFPSAFIKDMLIAEIRDVYNVPKPAPKTVPIQPGAKGSGQATSSTGGSGVGQTQMVV